MATDQFFLETMRLVSDSHPFQQLLRLNPDLARRSRRDRDKLVLEFMQGRAVRREYGAASYADAIANGYDPLKPKADYLLPTPTPVAPPAPILQTLTCGQTASFYIGPAGTLGADFVLTPGVGQAVAISLSKFGMSFGSAMQVTLHDLTDTCDLYQSDPTTDPPPLTTTVSRYVYLGATTLFTEPAVALGAYATTVNFVIRHTGILPFMYGSLTFTCVPGLGHGFGGVGAPAGFLTSRA